MKMFYSILKTVIKRKEAKIFLAFGLTPLLYFLSTFLKTKLFSFSGPPGFRIAFFDFLNGQINLYLTSTLPTLTLAFLVSSVLRGDFLSGVMYLYKDLDKTKVFVMKLLSLITVVGLNCIIFFFAALFTYYTRVAYLSYGSLQFWSNDFRFSIAATISVVLIFILIVSVSSLASLYFKTGIVIALSLIFNIIISISTIIKPISYFLPNGYISFAESAGLFKGVAVMSLITLAYALILCFVSILRFSQIEY